MTQTHQLPRPELWLEPHGTVSTKGYEASFVPVLGVEHRTPCVQSPPPPPAMHRPSVLQSSLYGPNGLPML